MAVFHRAFLEKLGGDITAAEYIGTEGDLFFAPQSQTLRISDGVTPGGQVASNGRTLTGAQIKSLYEAQTNTNALTDTERTKLSGVASGAEVNVDTNLSYTPGTRELASSTGTNVTLPEVSAGGNSGLISGTDRASYQETLYWIPYHTPKPPL